MPFVILFNLELVMGTFTALIDPSDARIKILFPMSLFRKSYSNGGMMI